MDNPQDAAELRIRELEAQLRAKERECSEIKQQRLLELQSERCRERLEVAALNRRQRSENMDAWSCDELAGWFQEIRLDHYCEFILTQEVDGAFLLGLTDDGLVDMGVIPIHMSILGSLLLPFRALMAHRSSCLARGDYSGTLAEQSELDTGYMRTELGVARLNTTVEVEYYENAPVGGVMLVQTLSLIINNDAAVHPVILGYSLFLADVDAVSNEIRGDGIGLRPVMSWRVLGRCSTLAHQHSSEVSDWKLLHEVKGLGFPCEYARAYFDISLTTPRRSFDMIKIEFLKTDENEISSKHAITYPKVHIFQRISY